MLLEYVPRNLLKIANELGACSLKEFYEPEEFIAYTGSLIFPMGFDLNGKLIACDLGDFPHLLVAGTTGSGKTSFIQSLIVGLCASYTPDDVKIITIDSKGTEYSFLNQIPHTLIPTIFDPHKTAGAIIWLCSEAHDRMNRFIALNLRDIKSYNQQASSSDSRLPHIIIVLDDYSRLLPSDDFYFLDDALQSLGMLGRVVGIHIILSTSIPSSKIISSSVKANIPNRIAFRVASKADSRMIIDEKGAEKFANEGEFMFKGKYGLIIGQRILHADCEELCGIVGFLAESRDIEVGNNIIGNLQSTHLNDKELTVHTMGSDELLLEAVELVLEAGEASVSMLQRLLKIGYARAGRLIDDMAARGIISASGGSKTRDVMITREQYHQLIGD